LYYAYECPLWNKRINEYAGKQNHSKKEIEFDEPYEPDEQPKGFTDKIIY